MRSWTSIQRKVNVTLVNIVGRDFTRITTSALHTIYWKHLLTTIVVCQNFYIGKMQCMETQLLRFCAALWVKMTMQLLSQILTQKRKIKQKQQNKQNCDLEKEELLPQLLLQLLLHLLLIIMKNKKIWRKTGLCNGLEGLRRSNRPLTSAPTCGCFSSSP